MDVTASPKAKTPTVLIVEDDTALANLYDQKLKREGLNTIVARDGAEGLNMAVTKNPDFILTDMLMPKLNGIEMLEKLVASPVGKSIPVIFLTNIAEKGERDKALALGAKDYLAKAMHSPEDIVSRVKKYLGV